MSKLYGISVGPGDKGLITLKAIECIKKVPILVVATKEIEDSVAYKIALSTGVNLSDKEIIGVSLPMTKDKEALSLAHKEAADKIEEKLKQNIDVGFLVLGDASLYSTYYYIQKILANRGYEVETIAGVNSFSAAVANLNIDLASGKESLHIIPATYGIEEALELSGTKIFMKAGKSLLKLKDLVDTEEAFVFNNVGLENESICRLSEVNENSGYYTLVIVKDNKS